MKGWVDRHRLATVVVGFIVLVIVASSIAGAVGNKGSDGSAAASSVSTPAPGSSSPAPAFTPTPVAKPQPNAKYTQSCDYLLGNFTDTEQGFRFIARASMHNTGNVGVIAIVTASWVQVGSKDVRMSKSVKIPWHGRRVVNFKKVVTEDQINQIQADTNFAHQCSVKATILTTYGKAH